MVPMPRSGAVPPLAAPLSDGVVCVRRRRAADLAAIADASRDPETLRWLRDGPMDEAARAAVIERDERSWREGTAAPLVIADAATDRPVGLINLRFGDDQVAAVAYSVFPAERGRGVASRAVELVVGWAFGPLRLDLLVLDAGPANAASIRVAEKTGFTPSGTRVEADGTTLRVFARQP